MHDDLAVQIGARLKQERLKSRLTLTELASRTGMTKGFLSRVERNLSTPSIAGLLEICRALEIEVADVFRTPAVRVIRATERLSPPGTLTSAGALITARSERRVTVFEATVSQGEGRGRSTFTLSSGTAVCLVMDGAIEMQVEDEVYCLETGDALTFKAWSVHRWRASGSAARVLWILSPGPPDPQGSTGCSDQSRGWVR